MSMESKLALNTQTEKPEHYTYLKNFRVDQCPLFKEHQCPNHKPFTCFNWHFWNQRRRRPLRRRDGTFNYSPDVYCTKYDEATGVCADGDNCVYLHKTAGDTEKHYHLRHYKTCMCMYDTDAKGYCKKNGPHCAYAHGAQDLRAPVLDIREIQAQENQEEAGANGTGPNNLDKERNLGEDPKWQDTNYVLANYKTEQCKKPPRLCRQGYTCPQYHNSRDRRRSPRKHKYRTTPCPHVKHLDEWGEPGNCENGDNCQYCHTRTEQQFHPEIYKSSKCNDMQQTGYCPRGVFCAFAHVDQEITTQRDMNLPSDGSTSLATFLSNALPQSTSNNSASSSQSDSRCSSTNGNSNSNPNCNTSNGMLSQLSMSDPSSSAFSNRSGSFFPNPIGKPLIQSSSNSNSHVSDSQPTYQKAPGSEREDKEATIRKQMLAIGTLSSTPPSVQSAVSPLAPAFYPPSETVESVVGNALDDLNIDDLNVNSGSSKELENDSNHVNNSISVGLAESGLLGGSAPVAIPGSGLNDRNPLSNLTPPVSSPISSTPPTFLQSSHIGQSRPDHQMDQAMASAFLRQPNTITANKFSSFPSSGFYEFSSSAPSSGVRPPHSPVVTNSSGGPSNNNVASYQQLLDELQDVKGKFIFYKDRIDEEIVKVNAMMKRIAEHITGSSYTARSCSAFNAEPDPLSYGELTQLRQSLRNESETPEKQMLRHTSMKCMSCNEKPRSVPLYPCQHLVCAECASVVKTCPVCGNQIVRLRNVPMSL